MRVRDEPIYDRQSISDTRKATLNSIKPNKITINEQSIKHERESIPISDRKRTREDISSDHQPNNRKRQSVKVKEDPIESTPEEVEINAVKDEKFSSIEKFPNKISIAFLNKETMIILHQ